MRIRNTAETTEWQDNLYVLSLWETASTISVKFILTILLSSQPMTDRKDTCLMLSWQPKNDGPASGLPANKRRPASGLPTNRRRPVSGLPANKRRHTWGLCSLSVPPRTRGWSRKPYGLCKETHWRRQNYFQTTNRLCGNRCFKSSRLDRWTYVDIVENRIFAVSSPINTCQNQFMAL